MKDPFKDLDDLISKASPSSTPSPASAAGPSLYDLLDGPTTGEPGPCPSPASPSRARAGKKAKPTSATSGRLASSSSPSTSLQSSLESKLRARLDVNGSLEYDLTWKHWDTESGPPICALRASARRTSVSVSIGWPIVGWPKTPMSSDGDGGVMEIRPETTGKYKLRDFAHLAGWCTPNTMTGGQTSRGGDRKGEKLLGGEVQLAGWPTATAVNRERDAETMAKCAAFRKANANQDTVPLYLGEVAQFAGWPTVTTEAGNGGAQTNAAKAAERLASGRSNLDDAVHLAGWPTSSAMDAHRGDYTLDKGDPEKKRPSTLGLARGATFALFLVPTGRRVVLAPEFSLWLMGFPEEWVTAAPGAKDWLEVQAVLAAEYSKAAATLSSLY